LYTYALFVYHSAPPPHLHSFPTRRSSDLPFLPSRTNRHPSLASAVRSRGRNDHGDGGVSISVGSTKSAIVSSHASYFGNAAASRDRKSTRLNSSHVSISYAVFCLKKKKNQ